MKKLFALLVVIFAVIALSLSLLPGIVSADHGLQDDINFDPGGCPIGENVINVRLDVVNDADSGITRYWAYDDYRKIIRVWQTGPDTFCVVVRYKGTFRSTPGQSPGSKDLIAADITGSMIGGYRATITGTLKSSPTHRRHGYLGEFNYGWSGDPDTSAPNPFKWVDEYFNPGYTFEYFWWGWVYRAKNGSVWVNSAGNSGDITD
jgi:hypothetical protein